MNRTAIVEGLNKALAKHGWTKRDLAERAGIDPGQLTRIMKGDFKRLSSRLRRVCKVAGVKLENSYDPSRSRELMSALSEVWDGSEHDAKLIGSFLRALGRARCHQDQS